MSATAEIPLVLGGHSFIEQLGNEEPPDEAGAAALVGRCLDEGVRWFDTTYLPERVLLGAALARLGRRAEARLIAWNFFTPFAAGEDVGEPQPYREHDLDEMLAQLQTDRIDLLVVHPVEDPAEDRRQQELAAEWAAGERVGALGRWALSAEEVLAAPAAVPYSHLVSPFNAGTPEAAAVFAAAAERGWGTLATSPFERGWHLDRMVTAAVGRGDGSEAEVRRQLADLMLRFALYGPGVDRLIVAMRRTEWVAANVASARRGPLDAAESRRLLDLVAATDLGE